jgi:hypothetical protein
MCRKGILQQYGCKDMEAAVFGEQKESLAYSDGFEYI